MIPISTLRRALLCAVLCCSTIILFSTTPPTNHYSRPDAKNKHIVTKSFTQVTIAGLDIDDDRDGIPDYVELNNPLALQDHDSDGTPNWFDTDYPGYVDFDIDGVNDNFDPSADSDNDDIANYMDANFPAFTDTDSDGINDNMDRDLDGIPNHMDLDSDNDGIPDVAESFGVDADGDGRIDNFSDPDNDGLSQNVDANPVGLSGSGNGLGAVDTDGDGVPNYLDSDSDNDGLPDVSEVYGTDANNDGKLDASTDIDLDGLADAVDGDVGNDGTAENASASLMRTGPDGNNDGLADSHPYKNVDHDSKTNAYDLDSDSDGITDVFESGFDDLDWNGMVDGEGVIGADGWNTVIAALPSLGLRNSDANGRVNVYDIDSDDDGIPDNIEAQPTGSYILPTGLDADADGIDNAYDDFAGFGGGGIHVYDEDIDGDPDFYDFDSDSDGVMDIVEGNDLNLNGETDDNVTLSGIDADDDGLDDRFDDDINSAKGTSAYIGNNGSLTGDPLPGSITTVQRTVVSSGCPSERDWRCLSYVLNCEIISFKANLQDPQVQLGWTVLCRQEVDYFIIQRSINKTSFEEIGRVEGRPVASETDIYHSSDDLSTVKSGIVYYRLRTMLKNGQTKWSHVISVGRDNGEETAVHIFPNPVNDQLQLSVRASASVKAQVHILDGQGRTVKNYTEDLLPGNNTFTYSETRNLPNGMYYLRLNLGGQVITQKFSILR